jgi:flagellar hook-length control protein FliK
MAIELQTSDSQLVKTNGSLSINGSGGAGVARSGGSFGDVLSTQAALFKMEDGKQGLNTTKLLSPDVTHANQLLNQSKSYSESNAKSIHAFEANAQQAEYILAMKNVAEYKQGISSTLPLSAVQKFGLDISRVGISGTIYSNAASTTLVTPRSSSNLTHKLDQSSFHISRDGADDVDDAESATKSDESRLGEFFGNASDPQNSHHPSQEADETSPEELEALGALGMNLSPNGIQDSASSTSSAIQLRMQSSMSSPEWIAELAQKTVVMFGSDKHTAVITLNSPDKGSLKIVLHVNGDQVNANFYSNDADVLQAIEMGMSDLKSSMLDAGLVLNQLNVGPDSKYSHSAVAVQGDLAAVDSKLEFTDLHSAKMVNFYV